MLYSAPPPAMDALIVDDDAHWAQALSGLLREWGFSAEELSDGTGMLEKVKELSPRVVILDIMMPGLDGLSLCKALKTDPRTSGVRVAVVSGKEYRQDEREAARCGADVFITKGDPSKLHEALLSLLGDERSPAPPKPARAPVFGVAIRGGRGPGREDEPGFETSCVSFELGDRLVVLDAGTGLSSLPAWERPANKGMLLLLTHHHPDHVAGLGALKTGLDPSFTVKVAGPTDSLRSVQEVLRRAIEPEGASAARLEAYAMGEGEFRPWPDLRVTAIWTSHPGATLAYRFECQGRTFVYCPDNAVEPEDEAGSVSGERLARLVRGADLLIHDARYRAADLAGAPAEGHSSPERALGLAMREGARRLVLFHLDSRYDPGEARRMLAGARESVWGKFASLEVELASTGARYLC